MRVLAIALALCLASTGGLAQTTLSFETCPPGPLGSCGLAEPWTVAGGTVTTVPFGPLASPTSGFPTDGSQWCVLNAAQASGGLSVPPNGPAPYPFAANDTASIFIPVQIAANPGPGGATIAFDYNLCIPECPSHPVYNDFLTVDLVQGGSSVLNLLYLDTYAAGLAGPAVTPHEGGTVTASPCQILGTLEATPIGQPKNVSVALPSSLYGQLATLEVHLGNGGDANLSPWAYLDNIVLSGVSVLPQQWQRNHPAAHLDLDGVETDGFFAAAVVNAPAVSCPSGTPLYANVTLTLAASPAVTGFELALSPANLVPVSSGAVVVGGQIVNLDLASPLFWLNGGATPFYVPFPGVSFPGATNPSIQVPLSLLTTLNVSLQGIHLEPAAPAGFLLTQGAELHVTVYPGAPSIPGPVCDDCSLTVDVTSAPTCWAPSGVPFYATSFTTMHVSSNGRVTFGTADASYSGTPSAALTSPAFVGYWTDLNPWSGGGITISNPFPGIVRVDWQAVPFYGSSAPNTYGIQFDCLTGNVSLDGLQGISSSQGWNQFLGMSPGTLLGATDPGAVLFAVGAAGSAAGTTNMIYDAIGSGALASLAPGTLSQIHFTPSGSNYAWAGM